MLSEILAVIILAGGLVTGSIYLHYSALRLCARIVIHGEIPTRRPMLLVLALVFFAHLAEVLLFAFAFYAVHWFDWLGTLAGGLPTDQGDFTRYFYFSISSYTTLGIGDIVPIGPLRILSGIEALTGLVLIAWSASFSYLMMERFWRENGKD